MAEKPTFCPRCKRMHVGICPLAVRGIETSLKRVAEAMHEEATITGSSFVKLSQDGTVTPVPAEEVRAKFDKTAYQREYMRKRRAARKAKP